MGALPIEKKERKKKYIANVIFTILGEEFQVWVEQQIHARQHQSPHGTRFTDHRRGARRRGRVPWRRWRWLLLRRLETRRVACGKRDARVYYRVLLSRRAQGIVNSLEQIHCAHT